MFDEHFNNWDETSSDSKDTMDGCEEMYGKGGTCWPQQITSVEEKSSPFNIYALASKTSISECILC
jgi:hypothetical protein